MRRLAIATLIVVACGPSSSGDGTQRPTIDGGRSSPDAWPGHPDARPSVNEFVDAALPPEPCAKMDILFVIDNSESMGEEQTNLATNFPKFIQALDAFVGPSGEPLDYRIAVTTTGRDVMYYASSPLPGFPPVAEWDLMGENGELQQKSECGMTRRWIERGDPDASGAFSCVAEVGIGGSGMEMPLYCTELALTTRVADGTNAGFLRRDALLGLVILTDEDDCSRDDNNFDIGYGDGCSPPAPLLSAEHFLTMLDAAKDVRGRWAAAVIAGPTSCSSDFGSAAEAVRLKEFVAAAGATAIFGSICDGDLTPALTKALGIFQSACAVIPPIP